MSDFLGGMGRGAVAGAVAGIVVGLLGGLIVWIVRMLLPAQKCPNCDAKLPKKFGSAKSIRNCETCGCKVDTRGRELKRRPRQK